MTPHEAAALIERMLKGAAAHGLGTYHAVIAPSAPDTFVVSCEDGTMISVKVVSVWMTEGHKIERRKRERRAKKSE